MSKDSNSFYINMRLKYHIILSYIFRLDIAGCKLYGFLGFFFGLVSITTLTIMGATRYISICHPDKGNKLETNIIPITSASNRRRYAFEQSA